MIALKRRRDETLVERGLTVEEFLAFTDTRPDDERWELIEGSPILSRSPVDIHQIIVTNLLAMLANHKLATDAARTPIGQRMPASARSLPVPDVLVRDGPVTDTAVSEDARVLFEVLSRSNKKRDRVWRERVYTSVAGCQHYVTISARRVEVVCYDRATAWAPRERRRLNGTLDLPALDLAMPLQTIYRWIPRAA